MFPSSVRKSVSDIKATFESKQDSSVSFPPPSPTNRLPLSKSSHERASALTTMSSSKRLTHSPRSVPPSIATVLDKAIELLPAVGILSSRKPSWIGPSLTERVPSPNPATMKQPVKVEFTSPALQPPVFICTDLSSPSWEPIEMESTLSSDGEYKFALTFTAEEGEYQYKLRLGPGDWWVCDDSKPKVEDGAGNENNSIVVKPMSPSVPILDDPASTAANDAPAHSAPLMNHEMQAHPGHVETASISLTSESSLAEPQHTEPLLPHESSAICKEDSKDPGTDRNSSLRHEAVTPMNDEQQQSPLFRHETILTDHKAPDHHRHQGHQRATGAREQKGRSLSIPEEADANDTSLELFPTDHQGIMKHLDHTRASLEEDTTSNDDKITSSSPVRFPGLDVPSSVPNLTAGGNESDEIPPKIELVVVEGCPKVRVLEPSVGFTAPMTPPMTPEKPSKHHQSGRQKPEKPTKRPHGSATLTKNGTLSSMSVGLAITLAAVSLVITMWYIQAGGDNVVL